MPGAADPWPAAVVLVIGGDVADGGVQADCVVLGADAGELGVESSRIGDAGEVWPVAFGVRFTLHHVGCRLPAVVRVVAGDHPLSGRALRARRVYRRHGRLWLVLELPDGGVTSVEVKDTDVLDVESVVTAPGDASTLSSEGARRLRGLLEGGVERLANGAAAGRRAGGGHDDA